MSGFCGWLGNVTGIDSQRLLERMASALPSYGSIQAADAHGPRFGLALRSQAGTGALGHDGDVFAAIEGYPEWSDPALTDVAKTGGQAKALLAAYRRRGPALLEILRGPFSFAIIDRSAAKVFCAIDRFGVQTLCYGQPKGDLIVFGSTTDAVRAHPAVGGTVAIQSIFDYLYFVDRVPAPTTIYHEQRKLAPGEYLIAEPGRTRVETYWRMPYRSSGRIDTAAATEELKTRLRKAVDLSFSSKNGDRVGAFLSGGLDSSTVVGMAAGLLPHKLKTFTIGFPIPDFDESYYAEIRQPHWCMF